MFDVDSRFTARDGVQIDASRHRWGALFSFMSVCPGHVGWSVLSASFISVGFSSVGIFLRTGWLPAAIIPGLAFVICSSNTFFYFFFFFQKCDHLQLTHSFLFDFSFQGFSYRIRAKAHLLFLVSLSGQRL